MRVWFRNVVDAIVTIVKGMIVTLWYFRESYRRQRAWSPVVGTNPYGTGTFTERFEYPEKPAAIKTRYRGYHRFDLTTCIGCDQCAKACPVSCIYIHKERNPVGKGFKINGFIIDYTKCMFCALCVDPCPVECIFMGSNHDLSCYSRDGCVVDYAKLPLDIAWGRTTLNPTAVAESKVITQPVWTKPPEPAKPEKAAKAAT